VKMRAHMQTVNNSYKQLAELTAQSWAES
jgi:hypothetical protein